MRSRLIVLCALAVSLTTACSTQGLNFRADERVEITFPKDEAVVKEPVQIRWTVEDFDVTGPSSSTSPDEGYFAVFIDRFPQPPGKPVSWLVKDDIACQHSPKCPNKKYYAARGIFTTTETNFTLPVLPRPADSEAAEIHHINIALLDGTGRRIGEAVWIVDFELERKDV